MKRLHRGEEQCFAGKGEVAEFLLSLEPTTGWFPENGSYNTVRKFANVPCVEKIGLHKSLDGEQVCRVAVFEVFCRAILKVESKMVVLAAREIVYLVPESPKKVPGPLEHCILPHGDDVFRNEFSERVYPKMNKRDPKPRMNVTESAFALFDVGFPKIDRAAVFHARCNPLGDLFLYESGRLPIKDLALHGPDERIVENRVSGDQTRFKERGTDLDVLPCQRHALRHRPHAVPHVHAGVPEYIQQI